MADRSERLAKHDLHHLVVEAFRAGGWKVFYLPEAADAALRLTIYKDDAAQTVRVYIWNVTHGGGARRPTGEYRIQITGVHQFVEQQGEQTLVLGWWTPGSVFVGFDYKKHSGPLGASPSFQVSEESMRSAEANVFAPYRKANDEIAIAFRPEFIGEYVSQLHQLHEFGATTEGLEVLDTLSRNPQAISDTDSAIIGLDEPRKIALRSVRQRVRDIWFRERVLTAYSHLCAICGMQLDLVEAAHIVPVADSRSIDHPRNGLALCVLHHRAFDNALVTIQSDFRVVLNLQEIEQLRAANRGSGETLFIDMIQKSPIHLPPNTGDQPDTTNVQIANELRGWSGLSEDKIRVF